MVGRGRESIWEAGKEDTGQIPRQKGFGHRGCGDRRGYPGPLCQAQHSQGTPLLGQESSSDGPLWGVLQLGSRREIKEWESSLGT